MAKIDNIKRLVEQDFEKEYRPLISRLGFVVNKFMEQVIDALNNNIDFDNLAQEVKVIVITVNTSGTPTTGSKVKVSDTLKGKRVVGIKVIRAINLTNINTFPTNAPFISFTEQNGILDIQNITGLQAANSYQLTIQITT